jgi:mannosyltransferase
VIGWIGGRGLSTVLGVIAGLISFLGSWNPSYWGDEAASVMSAERPVPTLFEMLHSVDAVHGTYYLFLHGWINLFGASEISTRLPSAIAVGFAAAGTVVLGRLLFSRRVAVIAGLVFAVLPRVTYMGAEARSYAIATAIGVWLTVLFVTLLQRRIVTRLPWLLYGIGMSLAIYSFLYMAFLVLIHAIVLLVFRRERAIIKRWIGAGSIAFVLSLPILIFDLAQHHQVAFLGNRPKFSPNLIFVTQWFGNPWMAALCWVFILTAIGAAIVSWRRSRRRGIAYRPSMGGMLVAAWFVLPTLLLELGNAFVAPMYTTRYLSFCTPAVALAVALGVTVLGRNWMRVAAIAVLFGLATPTYLTQRGPYAKDGGSDWRQYSAVIKENARPGDAVVFDSAIKPSQKPRLALHLYPDDFAGLVDVGLVTPYYQTGGLWDVTAPVSTLGPALNGKTRVWAAEKTSPTGATPLDVTQLKELGYHVVREIPVHRTTVYELSRETP